MAMYKFGDEQTDPRWVMNGHRKSMASNIRNVIKKALPTEAHRFSDQDCLNVYSEVYLLDTEDQETVIGQVAEEMVMEAVAAEAGIRRVPDVPMTDNAAAEANDTNSVWIVGLHGVWVSEDERTQGPALDMVAFRTDNAATAYLMHKFRYGEVTIEPDPYTSTSKFVWRVSCDGKVVATLSKVSIHD